jgi:hypothetical protein
VGAAATADNLWSWAHVSPQSRYFGALSAGAGMADAAGIPGEWQNRAKTDWRVAALLGGATRKQLS